MTTSIRSADAISEISWFHRLRLARGVGEQRGVEQRDERRRDRSGRAVGASAEDRVEDRRRVGREILRFLLGEIGQPGEEVACDCGADLEPFGVLDVAECAFDLS